MGDDEAFLRALDHAPADDLTRLVYSDWLDDHGRPVAAEYLRLVCQLTAALAAVSDRNPVATRLVALGQELPEDWRKRAAARFDAVLVGCEVSHKIATIKVIREVTGAGLAEAKDLSESVPVALVRAVPYEIAAEVARLLRGAGATVRTAVQPVGLPVNQWDAWYQITGRASVTSGERSRWPAVLTAFRDFVRRVAGPSAVIDPGEFSAYAVLADKVPAATVADRAAEFRAAARATGFDFWVMPHLRPPGGQPG